MLIVCISEACTGLNSITAVPHIWYITEAMHTTPDIVPPPTTQELPGQLLPHTLQHWTLSQASPILTVNVLTMNVGL